MEDVLDPYEAPYDSARPVVCFDESPKQLIVEVRQPIPVEPGAPARYDTGYERKGVCDLMMICEPKQGFRHVDVTDRRTKIDFAHSMKHMAERYPETALIRGCWTTSIPIKWRPWLRHFPPSKRELWHASWSSTTRPSTAAG